MVEDAHKIGVAKAQPSGPDSKDALARIVDEDQGRDEAENGYYETASDPQFVALERARRRFGSSYLRRLRRLEARAKHRDG